MNADAVSGTERVDRMDLPVTVGDKDMSIGELRVSSSFLFLLREGAAVLRTGE